MKGKKYEFPNDNVPPDVTDTSVFGSVGGGGLVKKECEIRKTVSEQIGSG